MKDLFYSSCLALVLLGSLASSVASGQTTDRKPADLVGAAKQFLATLDEIQRGKVLYEFKDEAQRKRWSNLPTSIVKRGGLRMGDLTRP